VAKKKREGEERRQLENDANAFVVSQSTLLIDVHIFLNNFIKLIRIKRILIDC
jgi:hypothetical protein